MSFSYLPKVKVKECRLCCIKSELISESLGVCVRCVKDKPDDALPYIREAHRSVRERLGLPEEPPKNPNGIPCNLCSNMCHMGVGEKGFCGLRENTRGKVTAKVKPNLGLLHYYLDPQVTNCCAAWFCPAGTGAGFPKYACRKGPEHGYYNLAIFFYGCNFDCLFCQNASHKNLSSASSANLEDLVDTTVVNERISCWCFFGGSPEPQLPFAINASRKVLETVGARRVLRICFEWNGAGNPRLVKEAAELALVSGGNLKFDLKTFNPSLSHALSGVSNMRTYENFKMVYDGFYNQRPELPLLTATTLMVPGYVDEVEVDQIAGFIATFSPSIPYSLLIFHPHFMMRDLPVTPIEQIERCFKTARKHLKEVHIGNLPLVGYRSMNEFMLKLA